jgi:hypothetical protein
MTSTTRTPTDAASDAGRAIIATTIAMMTIPVEAQKLAADDFIEAAHEVAWRLCLGLSDENKQITPHAIATLAARHGVSRALPDGGGAGWAEALAAHHAVLPNQVGQLVAIVQAEAGRRKIERAATEAICASRAGRPIEEIAASLTEAAASAATSESTAPEEPEDFALDTIEPRPIKGLWFGRLVNGEMTVITGAPGVGKGLLLVYIVAHYTTGRPMFGDRIAQPAGCVLWIAVEDAHDTSLVPRLIAAGADRSRIHAWNMNRPLSLPEDVDRIVARIDLHHAGIVIIDPAQTVINKDFSANADADVRRTFSPLAAACRARGCALVLVRHTNKRSLGTAMDRGGGSIAWSGMAAIELMLGRRVVDGESTNVDVNESVVTLATVKNNTGKWARSLNMRIVECGESARLEVIGETDSSADDLVAQDKPRTARKTEDAETLVRRILADGEWHAQKDVEDARDAAGISYGTLRRAKDSLGVESRKFGSAWKWRMSKVLTLPGTAHLSTLACSSASNTEGEHLHSNNINMLGGEDAKGLTGTQGAPLAHLDPSESLTEEVL